ncbi:MAG TPA: hypothetical protein DCZ94_08325 [Lentisphaeria bacterium]|nr:MAG: hypothetical protein A2X48_19805 [Lentisphaerae bacterium GWF2_49_21]HBC86943.1 hypothetical protein [Lentisphaeria bacterium]
MLTGIHILLTYTCNLKCDHCFLYSSTTAKGTMTMAKINELLQESRKIGTVQEIFFEGGEPFLFYPLMVEGVRGAREMGFKTGIVTNGYWATDPKDSELWLKPLAELGIFDLTISDDELHYGDDPNRPSKCALAAAAKLGLPVHSICKTKPVIKISTQPDSEIGKPEITGGTKLKGRAVEKFAADLPVRSRKEFIKCPYEDLANPKRVHIDCYGNVQVCQGISIGNCWKTPLSELIKRYDPLKHPICGPLIRGGPARLVEEHKLEMDEKYVDECHLCYAARLVLLEEFPECLAPRQVYGLDDKRP